MSILRSKANGDAHWSRDYIEHLRAVHFVLVVSAVTGIALSRAPTTPQLQVAQHQIRTITEFVNRQIAESSEATDCPECREAQADAARLAQARAAEGLPTEPVTKPQGPSRSARLNEPEDITNRKDWLVFTYRGTNYFASEPDPYTIIQGCSIPDDEIDQTMRESVDEWRANFVSIKTLDDFISMWDSFHCGKVTEFSPEDASETLMAEKTYVPLKQQTATGRELINKRYVYLNFTPSDDTVSDDEISDAKNMQFVELHTVKIDAGKGDSSLVLDSLESRPIYPLGFLTSFTLLVHAREIRMPSKSKDLIEQAVPEWKCREQFSKCFYNLDRVSRDKRMYLLKDLSDSLDGEIASNERQFEIFGIKFPTADLSRWGIVLVIAILVYFCLHLRELSPKMTPTDPGLDVAWIGLYSSWLAYCLLWVSVFVLPGVAIFLLGLEGARYQGPLSAAVRTNGWSLFLWIVCPCIVCGTLAVFCCLMARRLALLATHVKGSAEE